MNGVLLVDKPAGISSFGVIARLRKILGIKKIGHCGTLDNFATGVLIVLLGKATRLARFVSVQDKVYDATILFGKKTNTADITGEAIETGDLPASLPKDLEKKVLAISSQVPPVFSAIKIEGKRAYALARSGEKVEMKPREIKILDFKVKDFSEDRLSYTARVSKGTYIRTLSEDIAKMMGTVGTTEKLRRIESAGFGIDSCVTIDGTTSYEVLKDRILSADVLLQDFPEIDFTDEEYGFFKNGNSIEKKSVKNGFTRMYYKQLFVGVAYVEQEVVKPRIVF